MKNWKLIHCHVRRILKYVLLSLCIQTHSYTFISFTIMLLSSLDIFLNPFLLLLLLFFIEFKSFLLFHLIDDERNALYQCVYFRFVRVLLVLQEIVTKRAFSHCNYLLLYWKFPIMHIQHSAISDWLYNTKSRVLQADWLILENNEKATLNVNMPSLMSKQTHFTFFQYRLWVGLSASCFMSTSMACVGKWRVAENTSQATSNFKPVVWALPLNS